MKALHTVFVNIGASPSWIPQEEAPAYRVDEEARTVTISDGYFEDVYGPYRAQYIVPPTRRVEAKAAFAWEILDPAVLSRVPTPQFRTALRIRVALRRIEDSRLQGAQDLDTYLRESCVVVSSAYLPSPR